MKIGPKIALFYSLCSVPFVGTVRVLRMLERADGEAPADAFSGKLLFRRKEEFYRKYTSKRRTRARQPTFAS